MTGGGEALYTLYLEGELKLTRFGIWEHNGKPFEHERLIALFHRSIVWDAAAQRYYVHIGEGRAEFDCEDTAFFVCGLDDAQEPWLISLAGGAKEPLNPSTLRIGNENQIYCARSNGHRARFMRNAHQHLLQHVVSDDELRVGSATIKLVKG